MPTSLTLRCFHRIKASYRLSNMSGSILQQDLCLEYASLFKGSPSSMLDNVPFVSLVGKCFPGMIIGPAAEDESFRVFGISRPAIIPGSPLDRLYKGQVGQGMTRDMVIPAALQDGFHASHWTKVKPIRPQPKMQNDAPSTQDASSSLLHATTLIGKSLPTASQNTPVQRAILADNRL